MSENGKVLLETKDLKQHFKVIGENAFKKVKLKAVDGVSFSIRKGETFGLVGESGCGKSTIGKTLLRLHEPTSGSIIFDGTDITHANMKPFRKRMQIVFQDPYSSLNPRMTVGDIVGEPLDINRAYSSKNERREIIIDRLNLVGLNTEHMNRYPHEFSGGQRQRVSIARALALNPEFIVCDEPISALDVSIQAQVINKLIELQHELDLTYLFIAHDLAVVRHISNRVGVMYLGRLVELADAEELFKNPRHPYTQALLSVAPIPDPKLNREKGRILLEGEVPSPVNPPSGCCFRTRCKHATEECAQTRPEMEEAASRHFVSCLREKSIPEYVSA
ncbi:MAG: dipeptide ABC transporter ATP-binding protein [Clostridiales bacterium]|jgi:oligopeptide transport system ATP-binding protein|nr:dipeptide ABC transporter ATP-binding protein [Clostridiales bacterium]